MYKGEIKNVLIYSSSISVDYLAYFLGDIPFTFEGIAIKQQFSNFGVHKNH